MTRLPSQGPSVWEQVSCLPLGFSSVSHLVRGVCSLGTSSLFSKKNYQFEMISFRGEEVVFYVCEGEGKSSHFKNQFNVRSRGKDEVMQED